MLCVMFCVVVVNYVSIDGITNYFEGASLLAVYFVILAIDYTGLLLTGDHLASAVSLSVGGG